MANDGRINGRVKWFNPSKGFGFITRDDRERDVFVHFSGIRGGRDDERNLAEGQVVDFVIGHGKKGPQAEDVAVREE